MADNTRSKAADGLSDGTGVPRCLKVDDEVIPATE